MIGDVTSLLAGHLGAGSLALTALLSFANRLPIGFVRFCVASSAGLAALAAVLGTGPERFTWLAAGAAAGVWYGVVRGKETSPRWIAVAAVLLSLATLSSFAIVSAETAAGLALAGSLSSALLLGAVTVTMILGHWYLVDTSLSIAPLRDGALWLSVAVAARWAAVGAALALGGWEVLRVSRAADIVFSTTGLFFLFRSLTGLGAPLLLAGLIWQTVKIRSTQSATGLLYVVLILVLFGELISQFLLLATGHPL